MILEWFPRVCIIAGRVGSKVLARWRSEFRGGLFRTSLRLPKRHLSGSFGEGCGDLGDEGGLGVGVEDLGGFGGWAFGVVSVVRAADEMGLAVPAAVVALAGDGEFPLVAEMVTTDEFA